MPDWKQRDTRRARELRNAATLAERALWEQLSRSRLGVQFSRQMPVGPWFADFLCRELRLVIELDGFSHDVQREHDVVRDGWMHANGCHVLRFRNEDVRDNLEGVVEAIRTKIEELRDLNPSRSREGQRD